MGMEVASLNVSVKMDKDVLTKYLDIFGSVMGSSGIVREDMKNILFCIAPDGFKLAVSTNVGTMTVKVPAEVEMHDGTEITGTSMFGLKYKDIVNVMSVYSGLQKTFVESLTFDINTSEGNRKAVLTVNEAPIDEDMPYAENYRQSSKFVITMPGLNQNVTTAVGLVSADFDGAVVESQLMSFYLKGLSSIYSKHPGKVNATTAFLAQKDVAYTKDGSGAVTVLPNVLPVENICIDRDGIAFLDKFFSIADSATVAVVDSFTGDRVTGRKLLFSTGEMVGYVQGRMAVDIGKESYSYSDFEGSVVVDRQYFLDILKRCDFSDSDKILFQLKIKDGETPIFIAESNDFHVDIPVLKAEGTVDFTWSDKGSVIQESMLANVNTLSAPLQISFRPNKDRKGMKFSSAAMTPGDQEARLWMTIRNSVTSSAKDKSWD